MPFDKKAEYRATLDHLIAMARDQGWKVYAWGRAKELEADKSGLFSGIAADLTAAVKGARLGPEAGSESAHQTLTKHR
jgi:hypothetical protein